MRSACALHGVLPDFYLSSLLSAMLRSLSLPCLPQDLSRTPDLACPIHQEPKMVCTDIPLTPPMSPKPEQSIVTIPSQEVCPAINHQLIHPGNAPTVPSDSMDVDRETIDEEQEVMSPPCPRRLLEDEAVHLTRKGIKLSDFEVRGTLGSLLLQSPFFLELINITCRHRDLWQGPLSSSF